MPVRPFYIRARIDGRHTELTGGPKSKDGNVYIDIYQRDKGAITSPFKISQYSTKDFNEETQKWEHHLTTAIYYLGECIVRHTTDY